MHSNVILNHAYNALKYAEKFYIHLRRAEENRKRRVDINANSEKDSVKHKDFN